jgi:glycosyltransferase involved in cell wall biosynthesis
VVVPAYREASRIGSTVARLRQSLAALGDIEIIVVDDGSGDGTAAAARAAGADDVLVRAHAGKGAAVRAGVLAAKGATVGFIDADLSYPPEQLARLLDAAEAGADMVVGSRLHADATTLVRAGRLRRLTGRLFSLAARVLVLDRVRDTQCGIKAFRDDAARLLFARAHIDGFAFDVELFVIAARARLTVVEVPVDLTNAATSTVRVAPDARAMLADLLRIRRLAREGAYDDDR